jgi:hypothetical protein
MGSLAVHLLAVVGSIGVPFGLGLYVLFGTKDDIVPDDAHAADAAFQAEKLADARLQPFNGGAR